MATFRSKHTNQEIEAILDRSKEMDKTPFVLFYDGADKKYRFFSTPEKRDAWVTARDKEEMTPEIEAYQFTDSFDAPAPYTIEVNFERGKEKQNIRYGKSGTTIEYTFLTVDALGSVNREGVNVIYTIDSPLGSNTVSMSYAFNPDGKDEKAGTKVVFNIDNYITVGQNTVSILVKGRQTGAVKMSIATVNVFELSISSSFQINQTIAEDSDFIVPVIVKGDGNKLLSIYVDGVQRSNIVISESESGNLMTPVIHNSGGLYAPGKHNIQLIASHDSEYTDVLYYDFVIVPKKSDVTDSQETERYILVKTSFDSDNGKNILLNRNPTFYAVQYENFSFDYAYYSSDTVNEYTAQIYWEIENSDIQIQPISLDSVTESKIGTTSTLKLIPNSVPEANEKFILKAKIKLNSSEDGEQYSYIQGAEYDFDVTLNPKVSEAKTGLTMKLSAYGRSNDEPESSRATWNYLTRNRFGESVVTYKTTFSNNFQWSGDYGWSKNALSVKSGTWCTIDNKPFSSNIAPQDKLGCVFEIDFMTFDVDDENAVIFSIGDPTKHPSLSITSSKATLRSLSSEFSIQFKANERVKIAFVVYPVKDDSSPYPRMLFIQVNGVLSFCEQYGANDMFDIESLTDPFYGMIKIGNETGGAGIKIYNIRTYSNYISMREELNNFTIDSDSNLTAKLDKNDIYTNGIIDVQKLASQITMVQIEGNIQRLIDTKSKDEIEAKVTVISPTHPEINMMSPHTKLSNAGQSTLRMPVPSMHVKMGAYEDNKVVDADNVPIVGNRWAFRTGNTPEKKFRLQANYMDSSGCHNGAFLSLFNTVSKKITIDNKLVLAPPAMRLIYDTSENGYSAIMKKRHGNNPQSADGTWTFPYNLNMVPDSIPCVVVWKLPGEGVFKLLGQYVLMEEKKSDYTSCKRSIYDNVDTSGVPDPFAFKAAKGGKGERLWDNEGVRQFEIISNLSDLTYFISTEDWYKQNENARFKYEVDFEMVYPDPDDIAAEEGSAGVRRYWDEFKTTFVDKICETYKNQEAFDKLYCDGPEQILDRWAWAAYYCLALRNCCVDSLVRNMQLTTYGEKTKYGKSLWLPKWWDVDMQCGLLQSGKIGAKPTSDRTTEADNNFLFGGRDKSSNKSSWLWDGLEGCAQFREDVKFIDAQLYDNGWRYEELTALQDKEYVEKWNESLFNENGIVKYVNVYEENTEGVPEKTTAYNFMMQGDRTPHRHWFLKTSYSYFDAANGCGDYKKNSITCTPFGAPKGSRFIITPSENFYFGYGNEDGPEVSGILGLKGEDVKVGDDYLQVTRDVGSKDTIYLYAVNKLEKIDLTDFSRYFNGVITLDKTADPLLGSVLKKLYLGVSDVNFENMQNPTLASDGYVNTRQVTLNGISTMNRLEELNIRGFYSVTQISDGSSVELPLQSLKRLYAAGSQVSVLHPKSGSELEYLELPTSIAEITMRDCTIPLSGDIDWYKTVKSQLSDSAYYVENNHHLPTTNLKSIEFQAMGQSVGAQQLILNWLHVIRDSANITPSMTEEEKDIALRTAFATYKLTYTNCTWSKDVFQNMSYDDLILLSYIPEARRNLNGSYIVCNDELTTEQMNELTKRFGDYIFTNNGLLMIDSTSKNIKITVSGDNVNIIESGSTPIIEVLQGCKYKLSGIVFPVKRNSKDEIKFSWYLTKKEYQPQPDGTFKVIYTPETNATSDIVSTIKPIRLNQKTGEMEIDESIAAAIEGDSIMLNVDAVVDGVPKSGAVFLNVKRRTYPSEVMIKAPDNVTSDESGVIIINSGEYKFNAIHGSPSDYTGNLSSSNGGVWNIEPFDSNYLGYETTDESYSLLVFSNFGEFVEEEQKFKLSYSSHWKGDNISRSAELNLTIVSVIQDVLVVPNRGGNRAVYYAIEGRNGFQHTGKGADGKPNGSYSSLDLKLGTGAINFYEYISDARRAGKNVDIYDFTSLSSTDETGKTYNIVKYMQNINELNLSGCYMFNTEVDVASMTNLRSLNMYGTAERANAKLGSYSNITSITYGTPTYIDITRPNNLTIGGIDIQNTKLVDNLKLEFIQGGGEVSLLKNLISHDSTYASLTAERFNEVLPALTAIYINSSPIAPEDNLGETGEALENIRKLVETHNLSNNSDIKSKVRIKRLYEDTKVMLHEKFPQFIIHDDETFKPERYIRWNDRIFEKKVSAKTANLGGDGVGITSTQASNAYNTTLNGVIRNMLTIKDLSDLYKFTNLQFDSHNSEADSDFYRCDNVEKISIPTNTTSIGKNTFTYMKKLSSLDFTHATKLERIEHLGFSECGNESGKMDIKFGKELNNADSKFICPSLKYADLCGIKPLKSVEIANHALVETLAI